MTKDVSLNGNQLELETEIYNILTWWPNQIFTQKHNCPRLAKPRTTDKHTDKPVGDVGFAFAYIYIYIYCDRVTIVVTW